MTGDIMSISRLRMGTDGKGGIYTGAADPYS